MASSIYLDPLTHDFVLDAGSLKMTTTFSERASQLITTRLKTFYGEWFLDRTQGVKYFEEILKKSPRTSVIRTILLDTIRKTDGVDDVVSLEISISESTRVCSVSFSATLTDGSLVNSEVSL